MRSRSRLRTRISGRGTEQERELYDPLINHGPGRIRWQIPLRSCWFQPCATRGPCILLEEKSLELSHTAHQPHNTGQMYPLQILIPMCRVSPMLLSLWNLMGSQHEAVQLLLCEIPVHVQVYWKPHVPSVSRCSFHVPHLFRLSFPKTSLDPCGLNKRFWCVHLSPRTKMSYFIKVCHWFIPPPAALLPVHFSSHFQREGRCLH